MKIATLAELNDPFELFSVDFSVPSVRQSFQHLKAELGKQSGMICFSQAWHNPVQWSHYADKHRGLCLAFEVANASPVEYTRKRLVREAQALVAAGEIDEPTMSRFLRTKYAHWRYEAEVRCYVSLSDRDPTTGLYFIDFCDDLRLTSVIVGSESSVSRSELADALGDMTSHIDVCKARLAFRTFKVVRQRNANLWV